MLTHVHHTTMGLFDFLKNVGRKVNPGQEAAEIKGAISSALGTQVSNLNVSWTDGNVKLFGVATSHAAREKAVLIAGNHDGVDKVDDQMTVSDATLQQQAQTAQAAAVAASTFYTVQKGDSLSKIAGATLGDVNKWRDLFEANREVIEDPDKIYPGQQIRIPKA